MAGYEHRWDPSKFTKAARRKAADAVNGAAADTVTLCQSPAPVGWTRVTGFLAGSTQPEWADPDAATEGPITARVVARAHYAIYQHRRQPVLQVNGDAMARTLGKRMRGR